RQRTPGAGTRHSYSGRALPRCRAARPAAYSGRPGSSRPILPGPCEPMITIDGSEGEGGGQVLRTALSLSLVTGQPFTMTNIRGNRERAGVMRQHMTAVEAACAVGGECDELV